MKRYKRHGGIMKKTSKNHQSGFSRSFTRLFSCCFKHKINPQLPQAQSKRTIEVSQKEPRRTEVPYLSPQQSSAYTNHLIQLVGKNRHQLIGHLQKAMRSYRRKNGQYRLLHHHLALIKNIHSSKLTTNEKKEQTALTVLQQYIQKNLYGKNIKISVKEIEMVPLTYQQKSNSSGVKEQIMSIDTRYIKQQSLCESCLKRLFNKTTFPHLPFDLTNCRLTSDFVELIFNKTEAAVYRTTINSTQKTSKPQRQKTETQEDGPFFDIKFI
jgi:hypothetical protein